MICSTQTPFVQSSPADLHRDHVCREDALKRADSAEAAKRSAESRLEELRAERAAAEAALKAQHAKKETALKTKHAEAVAALKAQHAEAEASHKAELAGLAAELETAQTELRTALGALGGDS